MFRYNFKLALHGLRRFPKSTTLAVLTVALGLAASMTTLALLHMLSADPLPGRSDHLYLAWVDTVQAKPFNTEVFKMAGITISSYDRIRMPDAEALLGAHRAMRQTALADMSADVEDGNGAHRQKDQNLLATTSDFVPMFGVALRYGRSWSATEDADRRPVAVIDENLAQQLFGTTHAVDRVVRINNKPFQVIGVSAAYAPQPHFYELASWSFSGSEHESVFVPYGAALDAGMSAYGPDGCDDSVTQKPGAAPDPQHCAWLSYWVQLDTPAQVASYREYLTHYVEQQKSLAGFGKKIAKVELLGVSQWLEKQNVIPDNVRLNVWMAGSFLLLCMVNVAGLLAAKFMRRSGEIGIRRALGATRGSIFTQHVIEASVVCVIGGVLALPLTMLGLKILRLQDDGFTDLAKLDPLMFTGLFVLALAVGVLVGLLPAWRASAVEPGLQVKSA
ncbi:ABC transporter permease [Rhodanobacter sp. L36]|uniref:ABC transporter permease n=1 Tax=Rhodanobacter sp. L36 TaxID=1747221 RepID=UPI00131C9B49|nr:ABC transporter permease [Rhodanobacter sp. L36]